LEILCRFYDEARKKMKNKNNVTMKEKCPECGEEIDVAEDGSFYCHNCGNVGILE
jgi:predicted RNA-binding Zn-ribbon protein involved in translation (DUF1610 family)